MSEYAFSTQSRQLSDIEFTPAFKASATEVTQELDVDESPVTELKNRILFYKERLQEKGYGPGKTNYLIERAFGQEVSYYKEAGFDVSELSPFEPVEVDLGTGTTGRPERLYPSRSSQDSDGEREPDARERAYKD